MKILCILSSSSLSGGSSISFLSYIKELKNKDINIVVTCPCKGPVYDELTKAGIETHIVPVRWNIYPPQKGWKAKLTFPFKLSGHYIINKLQERSLYKLCKKIKPDIIYTNVGVVNIGFNVAKYLQIPHVYHIREFQDLDFNMKIIPSKKKFMESLRKCYSICITKSIQQHHGLKEEKKSIVIYDGIRDYKHKIETTKKEKIFLFVGRPEREKGIFEVFEAFKDFIQFSKDYKLQICGETSSLNTRKLIAEYCKQNRLDDYIVFLGTRDDVDKLMQKSHALIMASHFEGLGRVTAEAMFNNCLVIGHDNAGTKEQFDNGLELTGKDIALRWGTQEELTQKMLDSTKLEKSEYDELCTRAFNVVNKLYTNECCSNAIYEFFKSIADNEGINITKTCH